MEYTLEQLFEMQKTLDAKIIKEKGIEGENLLPNTVLALQVEICELANECRGFKHWSNDREPRTHKVHQDRDAYLETNPLLEEYADCLSFFLQIANQLGLPADDLYVNEDELEYETSIIFTELLHNVGLINGHFFLLKEIADIKEWQRQYFRSSLYIFYLLGEQRLGFTFEQIAEAYIAKNKVNHQRQANGY
ncbi:MAG: hypothetical protein K0Q73_5437 [Paenibacillus sp.]|jgi:dimeric dUTPase (all-alpha-NTP-PPase superfamily)|nr:hypothetical protein [Paenibacillus sp.]